MLGVLVAVIALRASDHALFTTGQIIGRHKHFEGDEMSLFEDIAIRDRPENSHYDLARTNGRLNLRGKFSVRQKGECDFARSAASSKLSTGDYLRRISKSHSFGAYFGCAVRNKALGYKANVASRSLAHISYFEGYHGGRSFVERLNAKPFRHEISSQLQFADALRYFVPAPSFSQGLFGLEQRTYQGEQGNAAKRGPDDRPNNSLVRRSRGFLGSESRSPLSAQIGCVVILSAIAGVAAQRAVWGIGRRFLNVAVICAVGGALAWLLGAGQ
jgi:hypothetical protein